MGAAVGKALVKAPVKNEIVIFLDDWSSVPSCGSDPGDIANMADADTAVTNRRYCAHDMHSLYKESLDYPRLLMRR